MDAKMHALVEWIALQHAPNPYWHARKDMIAGYCLSEEDVSWLMAYQRWYFTTRVQAARGLPDLSLVKRITELEAENARLKQAVDARTLEEFLRVAPLQPDDIEFPI